MFFRITDESRVPMIDAQGGEVLAETEGEAWAFLGLGEGRVFHIDTGEEVFRPSFEPEAPSEVQVMPCL